MGFKMNFDRRDEFNEVTNYPESYWRVGIIRPMAGNRKHVVFHVYENKAARDANVDSFFKKVAKPYYITGNAYQDIFESGLSEDAQKQALYEYARATLEGDEPMRDEQGFIFLDAQSDTYLLINGERTTVDPRKSFFDTAEDL